MCFHFYPINSVGLTLTEKTAKILDCKYKKKRSSGEYEVVQMKEINSDTYMLLDLSNSLSFNEVVIVMKDLRIIATKCTPLWATYEYRSVFLELLT